MANPTDLRNDRGTAAQSGAGDLALLGAVPGAFAGSEAVAATPPAMTIQAARDDASQPGDHGTPPPAHSLATGSGGASDAAAGTHGSSLSIPVVAGHAPEAPVKSEAHDAPPPAHGSGTAYVPASISAAAEHFILAHAHAAAGFSASDNAIVATAAAMPAAIAPTIADPAALETIRASVATLQEAIGHLAGQLPAEAGAVAGDVLAGAHQTVAALDDHLAAIGAGVVATGGVAVAATEHLVAPVLATAGDTVAGTLDAVAAQAGPTLDAVGETVTHIVDAAPAALDATLAATGATVGHALAPAAGAALDATHAVTGEATGTVSALLGGGATDSIAHVLGGTGDHGDAVPLSGSDPAGGVATLVGLVSAADVFQLHDGVAGDHAALSPALGALGAADVLAEAHPADALLGIADHHDGLLGGLGDHHDGLLGHGL